MYGFQFLEIFCWNLVLGKPKGIYNLFKFVTILKFKSTTK